MPIALRIASAARALGRWAEIELGLQDLDHPSIRVCTEIIALGLLLLTKLIVDTTSMYSQKQHQSRRKAALFEFGAAWPMSISACPSTSMPGAADFWYLTEEGACSCHVGEEGGRHYIIT